MDHVLTRLFISILYLYLLLRTNNLYYWCRGYIKEKGIFALAQKLAPKMFYLHGPKDSM
jgi:hypothetical protein